MREILFRGKDFSGIINHNWCFGCLDTTENDRAIIIYSDRFGNKCKVFVDPETIGQYTGLTDKNGTKIFEGDIVKVRLLYSNGERATEITTVVYDENNCCYSPMNWKESCQWCDYSTSIKEIEVIGNIYDNPELLRSDTE